MNDDHLKGSLIPEDSPTDPVEARDNVGTVKPEDYPDPANGKEIGGETGNTAAEKAIGGGNLSSSEMQESGMGEDEGPPE